MCLDVTKVIGFDIPKGKVIAYKCVEKWEDGVYRNTWNASPINMTKWNHEPNPDLTIGAMNDSSYPRGFHALKTRDEARRYSNNCGFIILKVELDNIHTAGLQSGCRVYVAKKFRVISRVR